MTFPVPDYENFYDGLVQIIKTITTGNGYQTNIIAAAVGRRELLQSEIEAKGLYPNVSVLESEDSETREAQGPGYLCRLPIQVAVAFDTDQSTGALPSTEHNLFQNDLQIAVYNNYALVLRPLNVIAVGFPKGPQAAIFPGENGRVQSFVSYTVELTYRLPRAGYQ